MTDAERIALERARPAHVALHWLEHPREGFFRLQAGPCPLLTEDRTCSVYTVRPFNCRRFVCLREKDEPWVSGPTGSCVNLERRLLTSERAVHF